jgi:heat shock protein HtpX
MFEAIRANRIRSVLLLAGLLGVYCALGWAIGAVIDAGLPARTNISSQAHPSASLWGIGIAAALWAFLMLLAWFSGRQILLASVGARRIRDKSQHPVLWNIVEEMAIASGQKMPEIYIIEESAPNAFAVGLSDKQAAVAVTRGLLEILDRDELQGVIAHEMAHIKNRDVLFMTVAGVTLGAIVIVGDLVLRTIRYSSGGFRSSRGRGGGGVVLILLAILVLAMLARLFAYLFYFAISRQREYLADASGAVFTRYPEGLARALEKITARPLRMKNSNMIVAPMYIAAPGIGGLFSTHPPPEKRIMILRAMGSGASYRDYAEAWKKVFGAGSRAPFSERTLAQSQPVPVRAPTPPRDDPSPRERARLTKDAQLAAAGYAFVPCACGARLKLPAARPRVPCPKCGRLVQRPA